MAGGAEIAKTETDLPFTLMNGKVSRGWNRGLWIRFTLAIAPTVILAILGYLQTH